MWARIPGDLDDAASIAGYVLVLVGGEPDMSIVEYAGLSNNDVEDVMKSGIIQPHRWTMEAARTTWRSELRQL